MLTSPATCVHEDFPRMLCPSLAYFPSPRICFPSASTKLKHFFFYICCSSGLFGSPLSWRFRSCLGLAFVPGSQGNLELVRFVYLVWPHGAFVAVCGLFSSWGERQLRSSCGAWTYCGGFSCGGAQALECAGFTP